MTTRYTTDTKTAINRVKLLQHSPGTINTGVVLNVIFVAEAAECELFHPPGKVVHVSEAGFTRLNIITPRFSNFFSGVPCRFIARPTSVDVDVV